MDAQKKVSMCLHRPNALAHVLVDELTGAYGARLLGSDLGDGPATAQQILAVTALWGDRKGTSAGRIAISWINTVMRIIALSTTTSKGKFTCSYSPTWQHALGELARTFAARKPDFEIEKGAEQILREIYNILHKNKFFSERTGKALKKAIKGSLVDHKISSPVEFSKNIRYGNLLQPFFVIRHENRSETRYLTYREHFSKTFCAGSNTNSSGRELWKVYFGKTSCSVENTIKKRPAPKSTTDEHDDRVKSLFLGGMRKSEIVEQTGLSISVVRRILGDIEIEE